MVLVSDRRPEQREDSVAGRLRNVAAVVMDRLDHQLQRRIDDCSRLLGVQILHQVHGTFDVGEQKGDQLALALEILWGGCFGYPNLGLVGFLSTNSWRRRSERYAALTTEFSRGDVLEAARSARRFEWGAALVAKLQF